MYQISPYEYDLVYRILRDITTQSPQSLKFKEAMRKAKLMYKKMSKRHESDRANKTRGCGHSEPTGVA